MAQQTVITNTKKQTLEVMEAIDGLKKENAILKQKISEITRTMRATCRRDNMCAIAIILSILCAIAASLIYGLQQQVTRLEEYTFLSTARNAIQLPLDVDSHNGHFRQFAPENVLMEDDMSYYLSQSSVTKNDWIVFSLRVRRLFYPIKLQIQTGNWIQSPKQFALFMGSSSANEWIQIHKRTFLAKQTNKEQTFYFHIDNMEWHTIQQLNYTQYKLHILDNHGHSNSICIRQFKIFGL
eukprot:225745_1